MPYGTYNNGERQVINVKMDYILWHIRKCRVKAKVTKTGVLSGKQ